MRYEDIDMKTVQYGDPDTELWKQEWKKWITYTGSTRLQYGFIYTSFKHENKVYMAIDVPHSWRVKVNSEGGFRRFEITDDMYDHVCYVTTSNATSLEEAVEAFIEGKRFETVE